jgi:hypothetical protein
MTYVPDFDNEIAEHLNDMAAELAELREIAETVTPAEETRAGFADVVDAVGSTLGRSAALVLPEWAV